jgi:signal transduction histidine kinase
MSSSVDILLVDDEARNLDALEAILADPGYRLLRALDADSALRLLLNHDVAAIVLDIKMPGISGFELARMIKSSKRFRGTPIVFLTAYMVDDQYVLAGYGAGGVDYLTKPVNPQVLRHKVSVFADLYRTTRELAEVNSKLAKLNEKLEERVRERTSELEQSEAALRAAARQKDEFLAVLAHELRNPLAPLRTGIDILLNQRDGTPPTARTLEVMNRQLNHMVRLIDDLLDVSRITRGLLELKRERVDLSTIVLSTIEANRPWFEKHRQTLSSSVAGPIVAQADPTRFAQILTNLLHNAMKFTADGGSVRVELERDGGSAVLRVIDSGVGVSEDQKERLFEMFARVARNGPGTETGLGIGLALARRLSELHDGCLEVSSEGEGRGTTFSLTLPVLAADESVTQDVAEHRVSDAATPLGIVVVEDNDDVADVLVEWLSGHGHRVTLARTGAHGLDAIGRSRPDLVICDLGLPDLDGLDVCRRVRSSSQASRPVMVALTGWGREQDLRSTKDAGFDYHLVKPVAPDALRSLISTVSRANARDEKSD